MGLKIHLLFWAASFFALAAGLPQPVGGYEAGPVNGGGTIKGVVRFVDAVPQPETVTVTKDFEVCGHEKTSEEFVVSPTTKGLKNVVVALEGISRGKPFGNNEVTLTQKGCQYIPHVVLLPAGGNLKIVNDDGILHNIHTYSQANSPINRAQPKIKPLLSETFARPEIIKVACDVHEWMNAYIVVEEHPYYALSDANGRFELTDVPAGTYKIRARHEGIGEMDKPVTVTAGQTTEVAFEIRPR